MPRAYAVASVLCLSILAGAAPVDELPTEDQLKAMAEEKKWPELLQATSRVLALRTAKAAEYDRVVVWWLRAEAQLQTSQFVPAADSFEKSAEEPTATPQQVDWGTAMSILSRKSDRRGYRPDAARNDPNPKSYDILSEAGRKEALGVLFERQAASLGRRYEKLVSTSLPLKPTIEYIKDVVETRHIERAAFGHADQCEKMFNDVAAAFTRAAEKWCESTVKRCDEIRRRAEEIIEERVVDRDNNRNRGDRNDRNRRDRPIERVRMRKRGLSGNDSQELRGLMKDAERWADNYRAIEAVLPESAHPALVPTKAAVQRGYDEAKAVLEADYRFDLRN